MNRNLVWTISGADSSGGAGIHSDLKTIQQFGVHACSIITAVTAQNNREILAVDYLAPSTIEAQLEALKRELPPAAIKIGMLGKRDTLAVIGRYLAAYPGPVVLDPVLQASSGMVLYNEDFSHYWCHLKKILPSVTLITPNILEAELILKRRLISHAAIEEGAQEMLCWGVGSVLIKGGHSEAEDFSQDYWTDGKNAFWLASPRQVTRNYRGSGCTLASAITAALALGYDLKDALVLAKMVVNRALRLAALSCDGAAFISHEGGWPEDQRDLPYLSDQPLLKEGLAFKPCDSSLGLYPVVDSLAWVERLLPLGVRTLQLRIKNKQGLALEKEIAASIALARKYQAQLYINDFWEVALRYDAYGVHLGQEDIHQADIETLRQAGLRLGLSTHCYYEVAHAHRFKPSYLACGPIFPTTSKKMAFPPQGLEQLKRWRRSLNYPLVAIGGINCERLPAVLATGVEGVALISEITQAPDPEAITQQLLSMVQHGLAHRQ